MQPPKVKYKVDVDRLEQFIVQNGLPTSGASCRPPRGYWFLAAKAASLKGSPSHQFTKAVANYYYSDVRGFKSRITEKLFSEVKRMYNAISLDKSL